MSDAGDAAPKILDLPIGLDVTGTRREFDSLGNVEVPADRYWGAQTQRSLEHFNIGNDRMPKEVYHAYGYVKKAAAVVNTHAGRLPGRRLGRWRGLQHEVALANHLHAERAAGLVRIVDADHGEEQVIGDADRHQQVSVDAGVGELAERGGASTRLVFHPDGQRRTPRVPDASPGQCCLSWRPSSQVSPGGSA